MLCFFVDLGFTKIQEGFTKKKKKKKFFGNLRSLRAKPLAPLRPCGKKSLR